MNILIKICAILAITTSVAVDTAKADKYLATKPDYVISCHLGDPDFKKCFTKNFQVLFREWKDGIPGLKNLGSIDPLLVKRISIHQGANNPVSFNAELNNVVLHGASEMVIKEANFDPKKLVSTVNMFLPKLNFDSDYKLNGRILSLALNGKGKCMCQIEKLSMFLNFHLKLRDEYGYTFTDIDNFNLEIKDVGGFHVNFENLFNGQKVLEDTTNSVFNENWRDFYEVLKPAVTEAVEVLMKDRLSRGYSYVPANYFVENIPSAADYKA